VSNPNFSRDQKLNLFETVFSDRVTALTMSMLRLMVQKNREGYITELRERFNELKREHDDVLLIKITSAKPLELEHKTAIISKVEAATKKKVQAVTDVNESLVGGVKVEYGGHVIDGTVTGNLSRLKEKLLYDLLKQN
jgi:F-type H+-transporting ATPase subunit delta